MGKASGSHLVQEQDRLQGRAPCTVIQGPLRSDTRPGLMLSCHSLEILDHFIFELVKSEGTLESKRVQRGAVPGASVHMGRLKSARVPVGSASCWPGRLVSVGTLAAVRSPAGVHGHSSTSRRSRWGQQWQHAPWKTGRPACRSVPRAGPGPPVNINSLL